MGTHGKIHTMLVFQLPAIFLLFPFHLIILGEPMGSSRVGDLTDAVQTTLLAWAQGKPVWCGQQMEVMKKSHTAQSHACLGSSGHWDGERVKRKK